MSQHVSQLTKSLEHCIVWPRHSLELAMYSYVCVYVSVCVLQLHVFMVQCLNYMYKRERSGLRQSRDEPKNHKLNSFKCRAVSILSSLLFSLKLRDDCLLLRQRMLR